jgi:uncharacterized membrane protein
MTKPEVQSLESENHNGQFAFAHCEPHKLRISDSQFLTASNRRCASPDSQSKPSALSCASLKIGVAVWCVATAAALVFLLLIFAAPIAAATGHGFIALTIYRGFKPLCHQIAERSFQLDNFPLAVCARCLGLYVGFAGGALLYPFVRSLRSAETPARLWLILAALPTGVDFALGFFGIWANTHLSRLVTATLLGGTLIFYVLPGLIDLIRIMREYLSVNKNLNATNC